MTFGVFRNEHGNAEFAIQVVRDAKSITWTPEKRLSRNLNLRPPKYADLANRLINRPEHSVYEGLEPRPLFYNPILTILARAIADNAFRDYHIIEELFDIEFPEDEIYHLR